MSDALKKIEEKHLPYGDHPGCPEYQQLGDPCDVVKLARALAEAERQLRILAKRLLPVVTATNEEIRQVIAHADDAERTLEEVAGD